MHASDRWRGALCRVPRLPRHVFSCWTMSHRGQCFRCLNEGVPANVLVENSGVTSDHGKPEYLLVLPTLALPLERSDEELVAFLCSPSSSDRSVQRRRACRDKEKLGARSARIAGSTAQFNPRTIDHTLRLLTARKGVPRSVRRRWRPVGYRQPDPSR